VIVEAAGVESVTADTPRRPTKEFPGLRVVEGAPSVADRHGASAGCSALAAAAADPVAAEFEAALVLRRAGAGARQLRQALRQIEELLDE
jgi:hypothetical protein